MSTWTHDNNHFKIDRKLISSQAIDLLEQMCFDGKAFEQENCYVIPDEDASCLSRNEIQVLTLPPIYRAGIKVPTEAAFTSSERYPFSVYYCGDDGQPDATAYRDGALLTFKGQKYILPQHAYQLATYISSWREEFKSSTCNDDIELQRTRLLQIKQLQELAEQEQVLLDDNEQNRTIYTPQKMTVAVVDEGNEKYTLKPTLWDNDKSLENVVNAIQATGSKMTNAVFVGDNDSWVVLDDKQRKTFDTCKRAKKINKEEVKNLIAHADVYLPGVFTYDEKVKGLNYEQAVKINNELESVAQWVPEGEAFGIQLPDDWDDDKLHAISGKKENITKADRIVLDYDQNIMGDIDDSSISLYGKGRQFRDIKWHHLRHDIVLKKYQQEGVNYLQNLWGKGYRGALLADDMGLGKTLQTLVFASWVSEQNMTDTDRPIGIICPVSLMDNWKEEYEKFINKSLWDSFLLLRGNTLKSFVTEKRPQNIEQYLLDDIDLSKQKFLDISRLQQHKVIVMSYQVARDYQISLGLIDWKMLVLDEAQYIKNPGTGISHSIRGFQYDFGLAITGTPVENSWIDLWTILSFCKNNEGMSLQAFKNEFIKPLKYEATSIEVIGGRLQEYTRPYLLRRMKSDVLSEMTNKFDECVKRLMPSVQWKAYCKAINDYKDESTKEHIFKLIHQLRLISLHPYYYKRVDSLLAMPADEFINASARFQALFEILDDIHNKKEKALIFLRDRKIQQVLKHIIEQRYNIKIFPAINGMLAGSKRQEIVESFNNGRGFSALILSAQAGGVGLNITGANHVIHLSREWNPAKEDQATDRAYRLGQQKDVHVYYLQAISNGLPNEGSFDEQLHKLLSKKRAMSANVLVPTEIRDDELGGLIKGTFHKIPCDLSPAPSIGLKELLDVEDSQLGIVLETLLSKNGYTVVDYNRKQVGIDVLAYCGETKEILLACYAMSDAADAELAQLQYRLFNSEKIVERIVAENDLDVHGKQYRIICFDEDTCNRLIKKYDIGEEFIIQASDLECMIGKSDFTELDIQEAIRPYLNA